MGSGPSSSRASSQADIVRNLSQPQIKELESMEAKGKKDEQKIENGGNPSSPQDTKATTSPSEQKNTCTGTDTVNSEVKIKKDPPRKEKAAPGDIDIMISYSHADTDDMNKIKGKYIFL
jgi:hypothetical protein